MAWLAELQTEDQNLPARSAVRRQLRLHVPAVAGPTASRVLVHNISTTGLLVESDKALSLSELVEVELPELGMTNARVVWSSDGFYGCQFETPVAGRVISAAQLRSPPERRDDAFPAPLPDPLPVEIPIGAFEPQRDDSALSLRRKAAIIVGLSASLWGVIGLAVFAFV